jgi:hypothetical protein
MVVQVLNIGIAVQKPQQFVHNAFKVQFFGSHQRKPFLQVKPHLVTKATNGACARAVGFLRAVV